MKNETNTQHTPGPWNNLIREWCWIKSNRSNLWHVETADTHETIVSTPKGYIAQFIASAPELKAENEQFGDDLKRAHDNIVRLTMLNAELLEALKDAQKIINEKPSFYAPLLKKMNSAIAKAEGKNLVVS